MQAMVYTHWFNRLKQCTSLIQTKQGEIVWQIEKSWGNSLPNCSTLPGMFSSSSFYYLFRHSHAYIHTHTQAAQACTIKLIIITMATGRDTPDPLQWPLESIWREQLSTDCKGNSFPPQIPRDFLSGFQNTTCVCMKQDGWALRGLCRHIMKTMYWMKEGFIHNTTWIKTGLKWTCLPWQVGQKCSFYVWTTSISHSPLFH